MAPQPIPVPGADGSRDGAPNEHWGKTYGNTPTAERDHRRQHKLSTLVHIIGCPSSAGTLGRQSSQP